MVFKMAEDRRAMYDEFSDKGAHSTEWFEVAKNFLKLVLLVIVVKRSARAIGVETEGCYLSNEMFGHIAKHRFMLNYLVWHQHGEVQAAAPAESHGIDDEDQMDDMIADIGMEYDIGSRD
jgi:hypothetical protein